MIDKTELNDKMTNVTNTLDAIERDVDELIDLINNSISDNAEDDEYVNEQKEELLYQLNKHRETIDEKIEDLRWR